jgi:transcription initiation factor IIE alpha subunit
MLNKLLAVTQFKNIWLVLPLLLVALYVPQALWGLHYFDDKSAAQMILILMLGLLVYCGTYFSLKKIRTRSPSALRVDGSRGQILNYFVITVSIFYFLLIGYVLLTAEKIALIEALRDSSVEDIALAREALFKTRMGWERALPYLNAALSSALMPFAIALAYLSRMKYRHWLLLFFCMSLLVSLEKALILKALLPVIAIGFQGQFSRNRALTLVLLLVGIVGALFFFAKMGKIDYEGQAKESIAKLEKQLIDLPGIWQKNLEDIDNTIKINEKSIDILQKQLLNVPVIKQKNIEDSNNGVKIINKTVAVLTRRLSYLPVIKRNDLKNNNDAIKINEKSIIALDRKLTDLPRIKQRDFEVIDIIIKNAKSRVIELELKLKDKNYKTRVDIDLLTRMRQANISIQTLSEQREKKAKYYISYEQGLKVARERVNLSIQSLRDQSEKSAKYYISYEQGVKAALQQATLSIQTVQEQRIKDDKYYIDYEEGLKVALQAARQSIQVLQKQRIKNAAYFPNYLVVLKAAINSERVAYEIYHKYNLFSGGQVGFAFNRLLWIPYVTAYDWLRYFDKQLQDKFLGGSTSFLLSKILGVQQFPIEREVFKYQFGAGGPQTGSANALFLVDAFVNFGWLGVIAYAFLLAALVFLVQVINNPAMVACLYFFLVQAVGGGLLGILFGNGLLLLVFLSFFIRPRSIQRKTGEGGV